MKSTQLLTLALVLALPACHSNVRDSSPSLMKDGVQLGQKKVEVDAEHAKVIMKSAGSSTPVEFSVRRSADPDQRMEVLGKVAYTGRGQVFGWIAKLNETSHSALLKHFPQLEMQADPDQLLQVSGYGSGETATAYHTCGPISTRFTPQRSKVYLVEFQYIDQRCELHVYDVTKPKERIPVESTSSVQKASVSSTQ
ncbi:hypothetical protein SAMN05216598_4020 [Pseudomonas asplenii]|uniref:Uncharacterized protein n=1 Tax=Pseudomonas asplenii TaxID=53407 RepID=A0A1H1XQN3_9PSED|nr:hypothetical protein [Pseudomonas asplenii]SDT11452.1 hypothetical protein SAMN05216598_4020 [Pseudomonas asplenii]